MLHVIIIIIIRSPILDYSSILFVVGVWMNDGLCRKIPFKDVKPLDSIQTYIQSPLEGGYSALRVIYPLLSIL